MASLPQPRPRELPLLSIRSRVLFPGVLLRLQIGRAASVKLVESLWDPQNRTFKKGAMIAVCTVKQESDGPGVNDLETLQVDDATVYAAGTVARVLQLTRMNAADGSQAFQFSLFVEGAARVQVKGLARTDPFNVASIAWLSDEGSVSDTVVRALAINVRDMARDLLELQRKRSSPQGKKTKELLDNAERAPPGRLADLLAASLDASVAEKQLVLAELELAPRLQRTLELLNRQVEVFRMSDKIQNEVEGKLKSSQREFYLRQQLRAINDELGSMGGKGGAGAGGAAEPDSVEALEELLAGAALPAEARAAADRELQRLRQMQPAQPEYSVIRTYLELMAELPWGKSTVDNLDIAHARAQLDADHHALDRVKKRIVEFLAVRSLKRDMRGPILCLVGPPGVGKTSLGKSVAEALGRQFRRLALGGVHDEAEIRGHRRTYIGALPGNIVSTLKKAGSDNPVLLLDEIDKLGRDVRGDPASALLEVLDPEQNDKFTDHYLNVPFDLSKVLFVATANRLDGIPGPLLDRMEVIELPGYTAAEKHAIAQQHLIPKQMERHGIDAAHIRFTPSAVDAVIGNYTREAGVRGLDRELAALCRHAAVQVAESRDRLRAERAAHKQQQQQADGSSGSGGSSDNVIEQAGALEPAIPPAPAAAATPEAAAAAASPEASKTGKADAAASDKEEEGTAAAEQEAAAEPPLELESAFRAIVITPEVVIKVLGPPRFESEIGMRTSVPGVSTGLAWTQVGGEILFIESLLHRGSGRLQLSGQLGAVMQESAQAALTFVRGNLHALQLDRVMYHGAPIDVHRALSRADLHIHFPAGGVPKDGPSAGVAVTASILSAMSGRCVRADTACTGEVTLHGLVLPVGGIKEKVLAAHRAGIRRVVLPKRNEKDVVDVPEDVRGEMEIVFAADLFAALKELLEPADKAQLPRWLKDVVEHDERSKQQHRDGAAGDDDMPGSSSGAAGQGAGEASAPVPTSWSARGRGVDLCGPVLPSNL